MRTIKIAGAGIAGLTASIYLAKHNYRVEIFEKSNVTGKRFNGDFQGIENWSYKEDTLEFMRSIGIDINFDHPGFKNIEIWGPDGYKKSFKLNKPAYYLVKRGSEPGCLDYGLQKQVSLIKNIEIHYNNKININESDIVATGPILNDKNLDGIVSGYTFYTNKNDTAVLIFDDKYAKDGYSYFLVYNKYGVIATCILNDLKNLLHYKDKTFELCTKNKNFEIKNKKQYAGTGNFFIPKIPKDKKIYIGEAGGNQDYLWGFGMKYAMMTGYLAAKSIIENTDYYQLHKKLILPRFKTSVSNRLIFALLGRRGYKTFIKKFETASDPLEYLLKFYNYSPFKKNIIPIS